MEVAPVSFVRGGSSDGNSPKVVDGRKNTTMQVLNSRKKRRMVHTLTFEFTVAFSLLFLYTFVFTLISIAVGLNNLGRNDLPVETSLWFGFLSGINVIGVMVIFKELAPDAFDGRSFTAWCLTFSLGVIVVRWLGAWSKVSDGSLAVLYIVYTFDALLSAGGVVLFGIYTLKVARGYNLLNFSKFKITWLAIFPTTCAFYGGSYVRYTDPETFAAITICILAFYFFIATWALFNDRLWHDELGYILGVSMSSIYLTQLIASLTGILLETLSGLPYSILVILFIVKILFFFATCLQREILELCASVDKDSVFPPLFSLQLGEVLLSSPF